MSDREAFETVASEIAEWELVASSSRCTELVRGGDHLPERPRPRA